jgi:hypothetical protein
MRDLYASGGNYTIHVDGVVVDVVVWRRPDIGLLEGAAFAQQKVAHLRALAARAGLTALMLDLSDAPPIVGPKTQEAVAEMLEAFASVGRKVAVVVGESATQRLQLERLARVRLGRDGCVFTTAADARLFLRR